MDYRSTGRSGPSSTGGIAVAPDPEVTYDLQAVTFVDCEERAALYLSRGSGAVGVQDGALAMSAGSSVSLDTYRNSFYEGYWRQHTAVAGLSLRISGSGRVRCKVVREASDGVQWTLVDRCIELSPRRGGLGALSGEGSSEAGGRLFVELEADTQVVVDELNWTTTAAPLRQVSLGVGACTYNREPLLTRTLEALLEAPPSASVHSIIVVNQGQALSSQPFLAVQSREPTRLRVLEQPNFGGSGGFTRAAMELLQDARVTHILFMDDDIALDASQLSAAAAFLRYANKALVLGGQMLDLFKPTVMFEAGCAVTPENLLEAHHRDLDLTERKSLTALSGVMDPDFNGWWFSIIPADCFRTRGLPLPIFIRGDDQEYGLRLRRAGVPTVSLPPLCVWHEPFYAKPPGWQLYYDLRNRLILASLHSDRVGLDTPVSLLKRLWAMIIRYDYQHTWIMIMAIEDFLKGPRLLDEGVPEIHARVTRTLAREAPPRIDGAGLLPIAWARIPVSRGNQRVRLIASFFRALVGLPRANRSGKECLMFPEMPLELMHLGRSYVLGGSERHFFLEFTFSAGKTWRQLVRTLGSIARYARFRRQSADLWRRAEPDLVSLESWSARLGLPST